jgi:Zn-dependent protease
MIDPQILSVGPLWYVVFLLSLTCHEAAHALIAWIGGDPTAYHSGQVSLNPVPHIRREPFGTVVVPILSYVLGGWMIGWGSAPYNPNWQRRYPRRAAWMALAGPMANAALMTLAAVSIRIGIATGALQAPGRILRRQLFTHVVEAASTGPAEGLAIFLSILFSLNLLLATFNLLPIPPLDGNTAVGIVLPEGMALRFAQFSHNQSFALLGLLLGWKVFGYIFGSLFLAALNVLYLGARYHS